MDVGGMLCYNDIGGIRGYNVANHSVFYITDRWLVGNRGIQSLCTPYTIIIYFLILYPP